MSAPQGTPPCASSTSARWPTRPFFLSTTATACVLRSMPCASRRAPSTSAMYSAHSPAPVGRATWGRPCACAGGSAASRRPPSSAAGTTRRSRSRRLLESGSAVASEASMTSRAPRTMTTRLSRPLPERRSDMETVDVSEGRWRRTRRRARRRPASRRAMRFCCESRSPLMRAPAPTRPTASMARLRRGSARSSRRTPDARAPTRLARVTAPPMPAEPAAAT
mmetsp:Transcript_9824/g.26710  ORF Transcript_9824/g.26710 Transcript_9824/m.26710 type:complete len:222 (-) Transcript_9824:234-899(-)